MVLISGSLTVMVCLHLFGEIVFDAVLFKCILSLESAIDRLVLKGATLGGE